MEGRSADMAQVGSVEESEPLANVLVCDRQLIEQHHRRGGHSELRVGRTLKELGPMFLAGTKVRPGLIGKHPKLSDLQDGDLKHHTDFRQVYAAVLENWLGCDSSGILKGKFASVDGINT